MNQSILSLYNCRIRVFTVCIWIVFKHNWSFPIYSVFRDGNNKFLAVKKPEESSLEYWANKNIKEGVTDVIAIGRQALADCYLPIKLQEGRRNEINWCTACDNCIEFLIRQKNVGCATYEKEYTLALKKIREEEGKLAEKRT